MANLLTSSPPPAFPFLRATLFLLAISSAKERLQYENQNRAGISGSGFVMVRPMCQSYAFSVIDDVQSIHSNLSNRPAGVFSKDVQGKGEESVRMV